MIPELAGGCSGFMGRPGLAGELPRVPILKDAWLSLWAAFVEEGRDGAGVIFDSSGHFLEHCVASRMLLMSTPYLSYNSLVIFSLF